MILITVLRRYLSHRVQNEDVQQCSGLQTMVWLWHRRREKLRAHRDKKSVASKHSDGLFGLKAGRETNDSTNSGQLPVEGILKHWLFRVQLHLEKLGESGDASPAPLARFKMQHFDDISQFP